MSFAAFDKAAISGLDSLLIFADPATPEATAEALPAEVAPVAATAASGERTATAADNRAIRTPRVIPG